MRSLLAGGERLQVYRPVQHFLRDREAEDVGLEDRAVREHQEVFDEDAVVHVEVADALHGHLLQVQVVA